MVVRAVDVGVRGGDRVVPGVPVVYQRLLVRIAQPCESWKVSVTIRLPAAPSASAWVWQLAAEGVEQADRGHVAGWRRCRPGLVVTASGPVLRSR